MHLKSLCTRCHETIKRNETFLIVPNDRFMCDEIKIFKEVYHIEIIGIPKRNIKCYSKELMTNDKLKIVLAGSGYLSSYIIKLAEQFEHQSITEYSRTAKNSKYAQYIYKDFDDNSCHLDEITDKGVQ